MSFRKEKVASTLQQAMARILSEDTGNPVLNRSAVVRVDVSPDLKNAVFFVSLSDEDRDAAIKHFRRSLKFLRTRLAQRVYLKKVPEISFNFIDYADTLEN